MNPDRAVAAWTDRATGRRVRQLTNYPAGTKLAYFRCAKMLADGRVVANTVGESPGLALIDPESGDVQPVSLRGDASPPRIEPYDGSQYIEPKSGRMWLCSPDRRLMWGIWLPQGDARPVVRIPDEVPGRIVAINGQGSIVILLDAQDEHRLRPFNTSTRDPAELWSFIRRPRHGKLIAWDTAGGTPQVLCEFDGMLPSHVEFSPSDPTLVRYCHDAHDALCQRIWTVRADGSSPPRPIRPQQRGEMITHEFWWPGERLIGYTYLDRRRDDDSIERIPWAEYAPVPTHLGIADLEGKEVYLSDPLNCYHTHLYVSPDGKWISGEGTDGQCFVFAAPFSFDRTTIDLVPLASIHTTYHPFTGQKVDCNFSRDGKWLLFNDTIDGVYQVCAVKVG